MNVRDTLVRRHSPSVSSRMNLCSVHGCSGDARARGLCWKHYKREQRAGILAPKASAAERFWSSFTRHDGCWIWTGQRRSRDLGYGVFKTDGMTVAAHRFAYELLVGPIPEGQHIDHLCRTPLCVNPAHLEPVLPVENWRRGNAPSRIAADSGTCHRGHPLVEASWNGGRRYCPTCAAERTRAWRKRGGGS